MGSHMSKTNKTSGEDSSSSYSSSSTAAIHHHVRGGKVEYSNELNSYESACKMDEDLRYFDKNLHARTTQVINSVATGVEVRAVSFDSLKQVTDCLMEMNQEVVKVILECKKDIWKNQDLFELVEEFFDNSLKTLDFCAALEKCLKRVRDSQLLITVALQQFDEDYFNTHLHQPHRYMKTLEELRTFKAAGDPFTKEFFQIFQSVYKQQISMLEKLQTRKKKLDKKLRYIHAWRKVSSIIFVTTFAAVLICSVVAAAMAAPPVAAALAAATAIPLGSMGKWIDSLFNNYESAIRGQKEILNCMYVGSYVTIKDLDNIRILIDRLENQIQTLLRNVDFALNEDAVKIAMEAIRRQLDGFMKNVDDLGVQADTCSRDIRRARTVVLQRIIKNPKN